METLLSFLIVLSVLVFVHEFGHYWIALRNGVKVEAFSIGFGPEIFGWNSKSGTRWKFCLLPLGGFVKMHGDMNPASAGKPDDLSPVERASAFHHKSLKARAAIVAAGPIANLLFAVVAFVILFSVIGIQNPLPVVGEIQENSPAALAGLQTGDKIISVDDQKIEKFSDLTELVHDNPSRAMTFNIERNGALIDLLVTTGSSNADNAASTEVGYLGIGVGAFETVRLNIVEGTGKAFMMSWELLALTVTSFGGLFTGAVETSDLGGPIMIAQMSGEMFEAGIGPLVIFMAYLSINLAVINLVPLPALDGGHLVMYGIEAVRGKPLGARVQEWSYRVGGSLILALIVFSTWNDLSRLGVWTFITGFVS
ncbi:RIP metalloprotease RseP [Thalassospira xiamenensis]|uniref:Zinc metalloprotease n=1 Tax=Thalassospira xiamenensis TaxID=220697 RepID=A0A285TVF1_9PROT|nr:RIP metalloprotease RseP [Thalassospira xiamenensis]SOC26041.1 regulator of sigma E protease [Thalassospira xiamenensis]